MGDSVLSWAWDSTGRAARDAAPLHMALHTIGEQLVLAEVPPAVGATDRGWACCLCLVLVVEGLAAIEASDARDDALGSVAPTFVVRQHEAGGVA